MLCRDMGEKARRAEDEERVRRTFINKRGLYPVNICIVDAMSSA